MASAKAIPKTVPAETSLDENAWQRRVRVLDSVAQQLHQACSASGMTVKDDFGDVQTVDQLLLALADEAQRTADAIKPRTLPAAMKSFDSTLRPLWNDKARKNACKSRESLAKSAEGFGEAPTGVKPAKWTSELATINSELSGMQYRACPVPRGEDKAEFDSSLEKVHGAFYRLVLLLPLQP